MAHLHFLIWIAVGVVGGLLCFWIGSRFWQLWRKHDPVERKQKPELLEQVFRTTDGVDLPYTMQQPSHQSKQIYLCVHDLYGNQADFTAFRAANPQAFIVTYEQRGIRRQFKPLRSIGTHWQDLYDLCWVFREQYPTHQLYLVLEGFAAALYPLRLRQLAPLVQGVFFVNLISHRHRVKLGLIGKFYFLMGALIGFNKLIRVSVNYEKLVKNSHARQLIKPKQQLLMVPLRQIYQYNRANRQILRKIIRCAEQVNDCHFTVVQSREDIFYDRRSYEKLKVSHHIRNLNWIEVEHEAHLNIKWHLPN